MSRLQRVKTTDVLKQIIEAIPENYLTALGFNSVNFIWGNIADLNTLVTRNTGILKEPTFFLFLPNDKIEKYNYNSDDLNYCDVDLKMYLMLNSNLKWSTSRHYDKVVEPLKGLWELFVESSDTTLGVQEVETASIQDYINWTLLLSGIDKEGKSFKEIIINGQLSGIEIEFNLMIDKVYSCD